MMAPSISPTTVIASTASIVPTASNVSSTFWTTTGLTSTGIGGIEKPRPSAPCPHPVRSKAPLPESARSIAHRDAVVFVLVFIVLFLLEDANAPCRLLDRNRHRHSHRLQRLCRSRSCHYHRHELPGPSQVLTVQDPGRMHPTSADAASLLLSHSGQAPASTAAVRPQSLPPAVRVQRLLTGRSEIR